ncbi:MAG: restriction endonuclease subunit S [Elusimicrobia bacterium]|nr:restriction endonuclease subunit S [Elusimicrobiota bacterium]MDY6038973.1 restriction endonuclease subunit S [Elusimicrobiaceae bacterium]
MQKSDWKKCKLGDVAQFKTGKLNSNAAVSNGRYLFFTCAPQPLKIDSYAYDQQAILLAGNNADGNFAIHYYEGKFNAYQRTYIINTLDNNSHLKYLYYALSQCLSDFKLLSQGTSTKFLTAVILNNFEINLPPVEEQKRIADILGAFDDKIELLQKQNKTLEDMAKTIFKSWFVNFDVVKAKQRGDSKADIMQEYHLTEELYALFPSSFEDSSLGPIPSGWEVKVISDIAKVSTGKRPQITKDEKTELYKVPVYGGNGIKWWTDKPLYTNPIIITGRVGTLGQVYRIYDFVWVSDNALVFETMPEDFEYLFYNLKNIDFSSFNRGSTQPLITQGDIKHISCVYSEAIIKKFHTIVIQYERKIQNNNKQIQTLTELRDSLLPRLISGKIEV